MYRASKSRQLLMFGNQRYTSVREDECGREGLAVSELQAGLLLEKTLLQIDF